MRRVKHLPFPLSRRGMLRTVSFAIAFLISLPSLGEDDGGYYASAEGLTTVELKRALHDLIQPQQTLSYGSGAGHTWQAFWQTDRMEDNQVRDRYSNNVRYFNPEDTTASIKNIDIEHVWAKSWFGGSEANGNALESDEILKLTPARDLFNLLPSDYSTNRSKSNNPIGVVNMTGGFDNGSVKRGRSTVTYPGDTVNVWEPADKWKGDFARIYFYMATCYWDFKDDNGISMWNEESLRTHDGSEWPTLLSNVSALMLQWARQDPVDSIEIKRNDAVYRIQGNRNPFVDLPSLSEYIWGTMVDSVFHADAVIVVPVDTTAIEPEPEITDFFEDFEVGTKGGNYAAVKEVQCTATTWEVGDAMLKVPESDKYNGTRSMRLRNTGYAMMTKDYTGGCDSLSFYAGAYGNDTGGKISAYYSADSGTTWVPVVENLGVSGWAEYKYKLNVEGNIRLRFVCATGNDSKRVNLDDVRMSRYVLRGDTDGNGELTSADVEMLVDIIVGKQTGDEKVADVNGDGTVTIADVTALVNLIRNK